MFCEQIVCGKSGPNEVFVCVRYGYGMGQTHTTRFGREFLVCCCVTVQVNNPLRVCLLVVNFQSRGCWVLLW